MQLRDYQTEAVDNIERDWQSGHSAVLLVMATGGGKTQVFCELLDRNIRPGQRGLVLVHRKELVEQARDRLVNYWPHWRGRAGIVMAEQDEVASPIVFATVQTLASEARLARLLAHGPIDLLVTDEAHHATAATYQGIYAALGAASANLRHLGVTATPLRADGDGLRAVFSKVAASYDIRWMVQHRYLVPPRWLAIQTGISLAGVAVRYADGEKDYSTRQLANVYETKNCHQLVVRTHQQYAADRQAVAFTATVEGAKALAAEFNAAGIPAEAAWAATDKVQRKFILDAFRGGRVQVLCNVGLYTEGLDVPEVACIHQVRPTQSDGLYLQMIGRALRLFAGKTDALILDYAPKEARQIVMLGDVLGAPVRKDAYLSDAEEEGEVLGGFTYDQTGFNWLEGNPAEIISRQLDYLQLSPWRWYRDEATGELSLGLGEGSDGVQRTLLMSEPDADGQMTLHAAWKKAGEAWRSRAYAQGTFDELSAIADTLAERHAAPILVQKGRSWLAQPPSAEQIKFARRIGAYRDGLSRGDLAARITHTLARQTVHP